MNSVIKFGSLFILLIIFRFYEVQAYHVSLIFNDLIKPEREKEIVWHDVKHAPFKLSGFEWINQDSVFRRLPLSSQSKVSDDLNYLAENTSGGQVRFQTDADEVYLHAKLLEKSGMYHMPATAQSGFDIYVKRNEKYSYLATTNFSVNTLQYEAVIDLAGEGNVQEILINFPLYNGVTELKLGVAKESVLKEPVAFALSGKVIIYGTSITQGGCVSRPGMTYSNILSRNLDCEFINLGFSGNGKGEPEIAKIISRISDARLIILDYEANAKQTIQSTLEPFVRVIRKEQKDIPILIMSKLRHAVDIEGSNSYRRLIENRDFQKSLIEGRKVNGDNNMYFIDGSEILGDSYDECTVDGIHLTDLGAYRVAERLMSQIVEILNLKTYKL